MGIVSENIQNYLNNLGKPKVSTTTTTAKQNEGLDLSSLMMMLYLSNAFKSPTAGAGVSDSSNVANIMPMLGAMGSGGGFGTSGIEPVVSNALTGATGGTGANMDVNQLLTILKSLGGMIG
jgi:hypothetical protein